MLSTHSLAILLTQPGITNSTMKNQEIKRISKSEMTEPIDFELRTCHYKDLRTLTCQELLNKTVVSLQQLALNQLNGNATTSSKEIVQSLKQFVIQKFSSRKSIPSLKDITLQWLILISKEKSNKVVLSFFRDICTSENCPEFNGY